MTTSAARAETTATAPATRMPSAIAVVKLLVRGPHDLAAAHAADGSADGIRGRDRPGGGVHHEAGGVMGDELGAEAVAVDGSGQAADDRDAEAASDLADRVVDGAARACLVAGTAVMIVELAGAMTSPMPAPMIATASAKAG